MLRPSLKLNFLTPAISVRRTVEKSEKRKNIDLVNTAGSGGDVILGGANLTSISDRPPPTFDFTDSAMISGYDYYREIDNIGVDHGDSRWRQLSTKSLPTSPLPSSEKALSPGQLSLRSVSPFTRSERFKRRPASAVDRQISCPVVSTSPVNGNPGTAILQNLPSIPRQHPVRSYDKRTENMDDDNTKENRNSSACSLMQQPVRFHQNLEKKDTMNKNRRWSDFTPKQQSKRFHQKLIIRNLKKKQLLKSPTMKPESPTTTTTTTTTALKAKSPVPKSPIASPKVASPAMRNSQQEQSSHLFKRLSAETEQLPMFAEFNEVS